MENILFAIAHKENRRLLKAWLSPKYNLIDFNSDQQLNASFDLCIIDGLSLRKYEKYIAEVRDMFAPLFFPVLLISSRQDIGLATKNLWKIIDELIFTSILKIELEARIHSMLMNRKLSLKLKELDEMLIKSSEEKYRRLFDLSPDAIFIIDSDGNFVECNNIAVERYGYSKEEFLKMKIQELSAEALQSKATNQLRKALESKINFDWIHRKKDGTEIPVNIFAVPIKLEDKVMALSAVRDISERKKAEEKIQAQLKELQTWQDVTLGREERIIELKREVNELLRQLGKEKRYDI